MECLLDNRRKVLFGTLNLEAFVFIFKTKLMATCYSKNDVASLFKILYSLL